MMKFFSLFFIALGGGLGSVVRYFLIIFFDSSVQEFAFATFTSNLVGCFLLGIFYAVQKLNIALSHFFLFFVTGFLGGLTTFSTFIFEWTLFIKNKEFLLAGIYFFLSLFLGFFLFRIGKTVLNSTNL